MARRLPPLNSLSSFEAAGRHLSITRAAAELAVTQAAVSHQVKALEAHLGVHLFRRLPRQLVLTMAGDKLLGAVSGSLDMISKTVAEIREEPTTDSLSVRLAPSFAAKWLSPRLGKFQNAQSTIELALKHSNEVVDFRHSDLDLAITYGLGDWPDVVAERVLSLDFFPVCSPAFLDNDKPLTEINNLRYYTLLHDADYQIWGDWFKLAGLHDIEARRGTIIDDTNVLMQAAVDGQGVALGSTTFVDELLESGRLVKPFDITLKDDSAYHVVCPKSHLEKPAVAAFRDWLLSLRQ